MGWGGYTRGWRSKTLVCPAQKYGQNFSPIHILSSPQHSKIHLSNLEFISIMHINPFLHTFHLISDFQNALHDPWVRGLGRHKHDILIFGIIGLDTSNPQNVSFSCQIPQVICNTCFVTFTQASNVQSTFILRFANFLPGNYWALSCNNILLCPQESPTNNFHLFYNLLGGGGTLHPKVINSKKNTLYELGSTCITQQPRGPMYNTTDNSIHQTNVIINWDFFIG